MRYTCLHDKHNLAAKESLNPWSDTKSGQYLPISCQVAADLWSNIFAIVLLKRTLVSFHFKRVMNKEGNYKFGKTMTIMLDHISAG